MPGFVRLHSVIPGLTITSPDLRFGFFPSFLRKQESMFIGTRRRKNFRKEKNISGHLQPIEMDPGSVIPDLIRDRGDGH
jgi:hypothetical protein